MDVDEIKIPDATVFLLDLAGENYFDNLKHETPWRQRSMMIYGRSVKQPRLTAWYGDPGCRYIYSGLSNNPIPWTDTLRGIKERVESILEYQFNSALLNFYRTGSDAIGFHSDDEPELGQTPVIASVSYGATRTIEFQHRKAEYGSVWVELPSGSLLVMMGDTQKNWKHGIKKSRDEDPRVNVTFRQILM